MSEKLLDDFNGLDVTSCAGGVDVGVCIQFTIGDNYCIFDKEEVKEIVEVLTEWLNKDDMEESKDNYEIKD